MCNFFLGKITDVRCDIPLLQLAQNDCFVLKQVPRFSDRRRCGRQRVPGVFQAREAKRLGGQKFLISKPTLSGTPKS